MAEASQEDPECANPEHVRHFRFVLDGFKSDVCHAQTRQELVTLVPKEWQSSSFYMVYNGTILSAHTTVQELHLQAGKVGDVHLRLRMQGGGNICECGERESTVTDQPIQNDTITPSHESTSCDDQPDEIEPHIITDTQPTFKALDADNLSDKVFEMEPHIIANAKATFKALDADGDGECHLLLSATRMPITRVKLIVVFRIEVCDPGVLGTQQL